MLSSIKGIFIFQILTQHNSILPGYLQLFVHLKVKRFKFILRCVSLKKNIMNSPFHYTMNFMQGQGLAKSLSHAHV